jgi:hypothetical protein
MNVSRAAATAAVLGGLAWLVAAALAWGQDVNPTLYTIGLVGFLVALTGLGYGLVDKAPVWLRAVVSVATPLLGYGVWFTISDAFTSNYLPVLAAGLLLIAIGGVVLARSRSAEPVEAPVRGRRAAR